jgi:hypothetical protein
VSAIASPLLWRRSVESVHPAMYEGAAAVDAGRDLGLISASNADAAGPFHGPAASHRVEWLAWREL